MRGVLAVPHLPGSIKCIADIVLSCGVEHRGHDLDAASLGCIAQVDFQHLTDVHTGGNAQRVQHDIQRGAVRQVRHILLRQDAETTPLLP